MKKLGNTLYVTRDGAYLHKERETLIVDCKVDDVKQRLLQMPLHSLDSIFCFGNIMVSPALMGACGDNGIMLAFYDMVGRYQCRVIGKQRGNVLLRRLQYKRADEYAVEVAKAIVSAKIQSSRTILQRHIRRYGDPGGMEEAVNGIKNIILELKVADNLEAIRGYEGKAAAYYFDVFDGMVLKKDEFIFDCRNRRPPKDPINAMLSFMYSILGKEISGAIQGVGLDPQVGFLHEERPGRDSLAQDVLEEFRAPVVDRLVLSVINRGQVKASQFATDSLGGVTMSPEARKIILQEWQARKREEIQHPFLQENIQLGLLPYVQAMLLARYIRGDYSMYPPYVVR